MLAAASTAWVNWNALWKIIVVGIVAGAGLPLLFAFGLRALGMPPRGATAATAGPGAGTTGAGDDTIYAGNPAGLAVAVLCFAVFLAGIGYGIYIIVNGS